MSEDLIHKIFKQNNHNLDLPTGTQYFLNRKTGINECPPNYKTRSYQQGFNICYIDKSEQQAKKVNQMNGNNLFNPRDGKSRYQQVSTKQKNITDLVHSKNLYGDQTNRVNLVNPVASNKEVLNNLSPYFDGTGFFPIKPSPDNYGVNKRVNTIKSENKLAMYDPSYMTQKYSVDWYQI